MGKLLALDFGTKRVGYAVSDQGATVAFPRGTILNLEIDKFIKRLAEILQEESISKIIIGLPLDAEADEGISAKRVKAFGEKISETSKLPIEYIDESNSTEEALSKIPFRKDRRDKENLNAIAAQVILERYMEKLQASRINYKQKSKKHPAWRDKCQKKIK